MKRNLTFREFVNSWSGVNEGMLSVNAHNFTAAAALTMRERFQLSFDGKQIGGGTFAPRTSAWGKKKRHPVLDETGDLKRSIVITDGRSNTRNFISSKVISTTATTSRKSGKTNGYAAVHNSDPMTTNYTVNQYSSRKPVQRQFMGFDRGAEDTIMRNYITQILLRGIPH